jgi:hypothetical protein
MTFEPGNPAASSFRALKRSRLQSNERSKTKGPDLLSTGDEAVLDLVDGFLESEREFLAGNG